MKTATELREIIMADAAKGTWNKGVNEYALELLGNVDSEYVFNGDLADKFALLNGAKDWRDYSYSVSALTSEAEIAARLFAPSEINSTRDGDSHANIVWVTWLDIQARALSQAAAKIIRLAQK